jgi:hypothetical protein
MLVLIGLSYLCLSTLYWLLSIYRLNVTGTLGGSNKEQIKHRTWVSEDIKTTLVVKFSLQTHVSDNMLVVRTNCAVIILPRFHRILIQVLFHLPLVAKMGIWKGLASGIA